MQPSDIGAIPLEICPPFCVCYVAVACLLRFVCVPRKYLQRGTDGVVMVKRPSIAAVHKQHMQYSYSSCELNAPPFARHVTPVDPRVIIDCYSR